MKDKIYIIVEGDDDEVFFKKILQPILKEHYELVLYWTYANETKALFEKMIQSIHSENKDYYILGDLDDKPDKKIKINQLLDRSNNRANINNIIIIITILEGWYLAGINDAEKERLGILIDLSNTDTLTIDDFNAMETKHSSMKLLKDAIIRQYDLQLALTRNESLNYYYSRII